jgi:hypothetical protein
MDISLRRRKRKRRKWRSDDKDVNEVETDCGNDGDDIGDDDYELEVKMT